MGKKKNKNIKKSVADTREIAVAQINDKYSTYPSNGLTPVRLAHIFREADDGDVLRQMELFEEMEEKDSHLFSQLQTRKNAVTGLDFEINPFSDDEYDKDIAEFIKEQIASIENLDEVFMDLLDAIGKGIAISEIIWGFEDGNTVVIDIKWRRQKNLIWDYKDTMKIITRDNPAGIEIPKNKFIIHKYKAKSGHPSRAGILRVIAWMYLFKNYDVKDWVSFCEVFGMPLRLGKYNTSSSEEDKAALMQALIQIGTDAAGIIPEGTEIEFKEAAKVSSLNIYESLARYCDEQISKAILGQTLTSDSGGGSYAQSKTHNEVRHDLTKADCRSLANTLRRDLIKPLVYFNFGEDKRIPYISFDCEEAGDSKENAEVYKTLICDIGLKIPTAHMYKKFNIPKPEDNEEIVEPPQNLSNTQNVLKNDLVAVANKEDINAKTTQEKIDKIADIATAESSEIFKEIFKPIKNIVNSANSLEEIKDKLDDSKYVEKILKDMDIKELDIMLQKVMYCADFLGRTLENE